MSRSGKERRKQQRLEARVEAYRARRRRSESREVVRVMLLIGLGFVAVCLVVYGLVYYCLGWLR